MKILVSILLILFAFIFAGSAIASSNLEVSTNSDFSNKTLNFNAGQTIYVRLSADSTGNQSHILNLRDSQYNQINSFNLTKNGNQFTASFTAPNKEGYFSLEAKVESDGSLITSVKTIKIGNPRNSNVSVSVYNNVSGQTVLGENNSSVMPTAKETNENKTVYRLSPSPNSDIGNNQDISYSHNLSSDSVENKSLIYRTKVFLLNLLAFIWPFK